MPFIIVPFLIVIFHGGPGHLMRRLFTAGIVPAIFFIFVLIPGAVKGFFVDILRVGREDVLHAIG